MAPPALSPALISAARCLQIDRGTAEVVSALRAAGIRVILLKGPAVAHWLYTDNPSVRPYIDVDLLVAPEHFDRAEALLGEMGFAPAEVQLSGRKYHGRPWRRETDALVVDLHWTLHGCEDVALDTLWSEAFAETEELEVAGCAAEVPRPAVRALHLALHLGANAKPGSQAWRDVAKGLEALDRSVWQEAAEVARRLGVEAYMGANLNLLEAGHRLTHELRLPTTGPRDLSLQHESPEAYFLGQLAALPGLRAKLVCARERIFPPPEFLRSWRRIDDSRRRSLARAYVYRALWCVRRLPVGMQGWLRAARKESSQGRRA